ncbi:radical SAM protein [Fibrobacter sp. UWB11]|uniref:radical SAM protein n=1 Tax=Fibrobacter sp. UWB11 TaxID=1896202 RepID=UPI000927D94F|nr:radical SAM protein [Fibrobacter sp. UWB11]SIO34557.1 4Fe-4S single cluster domain-containing protein [Fibrobacter sp. UWB11]
MSYFLLTKNLNNNIIFYDPVKDVLYENGIKDNGYNRTLTREPYDLCMEITNNCPFSCKNCFCERGKDFLSLEQFSKIIDLYQNKIIRICLSGGEPTINPFFLDMVKRLNTIDNIGRVLSTTGYNYTEEMAHLMSDSFWTVSVSLHGQEETHNQYVGGDAYEKARRTLEILSKYGINIHLYSVLHNSMNIQDIEHLIEIKEMYNVSVLRFIKIRKIGIYQSDLSRVESIINNYLCDDIVYKKDKSNTFFVSAKMQERLSR